MVCYCSVTERSGCDFWVRQGGHYQALSGRRENGGILLGFSSCTPHLLKLYLSHVWKLRRWESNSYFVARESKHDHRIPRIVMRIKHVEN